MSLNLSEKRDSGRILKFHIITEQNKHTWKLFENRDCLRNRFGFIYLAIYIFLNVNTGRDMLNFCPAFEQKSRFTPCFLFTIRVSFRFKDLSFIFIPSSSIRHLSGIIALFGGDY